MTMSQDLWERWPAAATSGGQRETAEEPQCETADQPQPRPLKGDGDDRLARWLERARDRDLAADPLGWLQRARSTSLRNIAGWEKQAGRVRRAGEDPAGLLAAIAAAREEVASLAAVIGRLADAGRVEQERGAREWIADQARRLSASANDQEEP